jgi:hypothetical protein
MFYTYIHKTQDQGRTFYVGKGKGERATWAHTRGAHWNSVVKKHGGFVAEIVDRFDTEEEAFAHERFLITSLRLFGVRLVNKTDGGDGMAGFKHSKETRRRLSEIQKGKVIPEETRRRMSVARSGVPRPDLRVKRGPYPEERRQKLRKPKSEQGRANMKAARANVRKPVFCKSTGMEFQSIADAAGWLRNNGFPKASKSAITEVCQGKRPHAYGMQWIYTKERNHQ